MFFLSDLGNPLDDQEWYRRRELRLWARLNPFPTFFLVHIKINSMVETKCVRSQNSRFKILIIFVFSGGFLNQKQQCPIMLECKYDFVSISLLASFIAVVFFFSLSLLYQHAK